MLQLDQRLARIVARTSEPALGQMRLAWWRETLAVAVDERPRGDAVLDAVGQEWRGEEGALTLLIDGWEHLLAAPALTDSAARGFAQGRCAALLAAHTGAGRDAPPARYAAMMAAAWHWSMADFAARVSRAEERALLVEVGLSGPESGASRIPPHARGLAVLGALGLRSLRRGGRPLMEGRGASLTAMKAALLGR